jgi:hypothetical protein
MSAPSDLDTFNDAAFGLRWADTRLGQDGKPMRLPQAIKSLELRLDASETKANRHQSWAVYLGIGLGFSLLWGFGNMKGEEHYQTKLRVLECATKSVADEAGNLSGPPIFCVNGKPVSPGR